MAIPNEMQIRSDPRLLQGLPGYRPSWPVPREIAETRRCDASGQNVANIHVHHAEVCVLGRVQSHDPGSARHVGVLSDDL